MYIRFKKPYLILKVLKTISIIDSLNYLVLCMWVINLTMKHWRKRTLFLMGISVLLLHYIHSSQRILIFKLGNMLLSIVFHFLHVRFPTMFLSYRLSLKWSVAESLELELVINSLRSETSLPENNHPVTCPLSISPRELSDLFFSFLQMAWSEIFLYVSENPLPQR